MKRSNIHSRVWIVIWIIVSSFHIRKQKISRISINYLYFMELYDTFTFFLDFITSFVSLVIGYVMVYNVTYTNYVSLLKFCVTGCFQYIHSWRRATIWKKVSTFEQSEYIIWIFSTTSSVKDNVLWMKCNFMLHSKNEFVSRFCCGK